MVDLSKYELTPREEYVYKGVKELGSVKKLLSFELFEEDEKGTEYQIQTWERNLENALKKAKKKIGTYNDPDWGLNIKCQSILQIYNFYEYRKDTRQDIINNLVEFTIKQNKSSIRNSLMDLKGVGFRTAVNIQRWAEKYSETKISIPEPKPVFTLQGIKLPENLSMEDLGHDTEGNLLGFTPAYYLEDLKSKLDLNVSVLGYELDEKAARKLSKELNRYFSNLEKQKKCNRNY